MPPQKLVNRHSNSSAIRTYASRQAGVDSIMIGSA